MIVFKSDKDVEVMKRAGAMLHRTLEEIRDYIEVGQSTAHIDNKIEEIIKRQGGEPGFKKVPGYSWASCICVNEQIVHTPPSSRKINSGDVVTIDAGVFLDGLHTDSAVTIQVGKKDKNVEAFLQTGKEALTKALKLTKNGNRIGHISEAFQSTIEGAGYSIIRELTGHGVGRELHEDPYVPCFLDRPIEETLPIEPGMTLAIEVMYAMGDRFTVQESDDWSIAMADKSLAACFEHTVAVQKNRTLILT